MRAGGKPTFIYARCSTEEQTRSGLGLDDQITRGMAYCVSLGIPDDAAHVQLCVDEGVSGSVPFEKRPGGADLMRRIREGLAGGVVSIKLDRLFRAASDALEVTREWDRLGVALHLIDHGGQAMNTKSAFGKAFFTMAAAFAELERNLISERTKSALAQKKERGDRLGGTPLGYVKPAPGEPFERDTDELRTVELILKLRRRDPKRWSYREIGKRLAAEGHRTKHGGQWAAQTIKRIWDRREQYGALP